MRWPGRRCYKLPINGYLISGNIGVDAARTFYFRLTCWIRRTLFTVDYACCREHLCTVADRCDRLTGIIEVTYHCQHLLIETNILGCPSAWDHQRVVVCWIYIVKRCVEREIVARLLRIRLVAFKVVHRGFDGVLCRLIGADSVYRVANHLKRLKWDHHFVVFHEVAHEHENFCTFHSNHRLSRKREPNRQDA